MAFEVVAAKFLTNSLNISDQTNAGFFQVNLSPIHMKIG